MGLFNLEWFNNGNWPDCGVLASLGLWVYLGHVLKAQGRGSTPCQGLGCDFLAAYFSFSMSPFRSGDHLFVPFHRPLHVRKLLFR
jgi:hypothetical protein